MNNNFKRTAMTPYPSDEQIIQSMNNLLDPKTFNESYNFLFKFSCEFDLKYKHYKYLLPLFSFYKNDFNEDVQIKELISKLFIEFMHIRGVSLFLVDEKFHEVIFNDFPKYGTLKMLSILLKFDLATEEYDECCKFPKESIYYDEYKKAYDDLAYTKGYNHVARYCLQNNIVEKLKQMNINDILECLFYFGDYYISFKYMEDILNDIYNLLFSDSDIKTKAICIDILGNFARSSLGGLQFTINRPEFIGLFNVNNDIEIIYSLITYIENAFMAFNFIPENVCLKLFDYLHDCIQINDNDIMCEAIFSFSNGYKGLEKYSQFCFDNNYVQKFFEMLYEYNYPFKVQIELVRAICRIFSVSSQDVSVAIFNMGIIQMLHDFMESTSNYIIEDLLEAIHNILFVSEVNPSFKEWSELLFSDDDIVRVIENFSFKDGQVVDIGVNSIKLLAYSLLSKNPFL